MTYKIEITEENHKDLIWMLNYLTKALPCSFFDCVKLYDDDKELKLTIDDETNLWAFDGKIVE